MSRILTKLIISNTFEDWFITTNDVIDVLEDVVTIGDAEINNGNILLNGSISSSGIVKVDEIDVNSISATRLRLQKPVTINHNDDTGIIINRADPGTNEGAISVKYNFEGVTKWQLASNATHDTFFIANGPIGYALELATNETETGGILLGNGVEISNTILPSQLTGNAASSTNWASASKVVFSGDIVGEFSIQGGEVSDIAVSIQVENDSHTHDARYYTETESDLKYLPVAGNAVKSDGNIRIPVGKAYEFGPVGAAKGDPANVILKADTSSFTIETDRDFKVFLKQKNFTISSQLQNATVQNILALNHQSGNLEVRGDVTAKANLSDRRKKENIVKIENALDKLETLSGYTFNYIGATERMTGVMSDEVKAVLPEVVYEIEKDGETVEAVRYGNMIGLVIEAIKELRREIEEIKRG